MIQMKLQKKNLAKVFSCTKENLNINDIWNNKIVWLIVRICIHLYSFMSIKINKILSSTFVYEPILLLMLTFLVTYLFGLKSDFIKTFNEW